MADKAPKNNAHCTIPDDEEQSTYRFIIVAAKRARQLQGGARPVLPTSSKKPTIIAMEEVRRGLVKYSSPDRRRSRCRPRSRPLGAWLEIRNADSRKTNGATTVGSGQSLAKIYEDYSRRRRRHRGIQGRRVGAPADAARPRSAGGDDGRRAGFVRR
jgi:DNA-directed RNA polymerase subunit omega